MPTTLGDLRTYCSQVASPDSSGSTAQREFMVYINAALERVYSEHSWDHIQKRHKIYLEPEETGVAMGLTRGSRAITLGGAETLLQKYVDDQWTLLVDGEGRLFFKLASIDDAPTNQNGTLEEGGNWVAATDAAASYTWVRDVYDLPDNAKQVYRVQLVQNDALLKGLPPWEFDHVKQSLSNQRGGNPACYTLRRGKIEIWPAAGETAQTLEITYRMAAPRYTVNDADDTEVDWPDEWRDLLEKAIQLEASYLLAEHAPVPYPAAKMEYEDRKNRYMGLDTKKDMGAGPLRPYVYGRGCPPGSIRSFSYRGPWSDNG